MFQIVFFLAFVITPVFANDGLSSLFTPYGEMQTALAADDLAAAKQSAGQLQAAISAMDEGHLKNPVKKAWAHHKSQLEGATAKAKEASDIATVRTHFKNVSTAMIALSDVAKPDGFRQFHCPMAFQNKGANWLQKGTATSNPYFGSRMLRCGAPVKANVDHDGHDGHNHKHH